MSFAYVVAMQCIIYLLVHDQIRCGSIFEPFRYRLEGGKLSQNYLFVLSLLQEEFEDTKGAIRIRILKKSRQHNGKRKRAKGQTTFNKTYI